MIVLAPIECETFHINIHFRLLMRDRTHYSGRRFPCQSFHMGTASQLMKGCPATPSINTCFIRSHILFLYVCWNFFKVWNIYFALPMRDRTHHSDQHFPYKSFDMGMASELMKECPVNPSINTCFIRTFFCCSMFEIKALESLEYSYSSYQQQ